MISPSEASAERDYGRKKDIHSAIYAISLIFTGWALGIFLVVFFNSFHDEQKLTVLSNDQIRAEAAASTCVRLKMISALDKTSLPLTTGNLSDIKHACSESKGASLPEQWTERARAQLEILTAPTQAAPQ